MMDAPTQTGPANPATEPMAVKKAAKPATKKAAVKKVPANKPAAKKAGNRDLSAAVKAVHSGTKRTATRAAAQADIDLAKVDPQLLLAAGDLPTRKAFWDFDLEKPFTRDGRKVHLDIGRQARIPDYMTRDGKRTQRSMITIPPKLREQIRILSVSIGTKMRWERRPSSRWPAGRRSVWSRKTSGWWSTLLRTIRMRTNASKCDGRSTSCASRAASAEHTQGPSGPFLMTFLEADGEGSRGRARPSLRMRATGVAPRRYDPCASGSRPARPRRGADAPLHVAWRKPADGTPPMASGFGLVGANARVGACGRAGAGADPAAT